jgi:NitT/TauT family transport system permease protein
MAAALETAALEAGPRGDERLASELAGLDALEQSSRPSASLAVRAWRTTWPKVAAIGLALLAWQLVVWSGWRPTYVLPGPTTVLSRFWSDLGEAETWKAVATTLRRAAVGFALAVLVGVVIGLAVSRFRSLRTAVGSLITGLQTMPSIAWFPLALLLFRLSEGAILFVVVIGAGPSIANGLIAGVDNVPPILTRAGRVLGAKGLGAYRHVILPAALPSFLTGLKQGWAFAWRSLMAGELLVIIANQPSIGSRLQFEREFADSAGLMAVMLLILVIGVAVDAIAFSTLERHVHRRRGLGAS